MQVLTRTGLWLWSVGVGLFRLKFLVAKIVELGSNSGFRAAKCRLQFLYGSFWIGFDSPLKFVVVDKGWSSTALVVSEVHIFCREVEEQTVDCLKESSVLTKCIVDVSGRSAHVVVLTPLIVDDCLTHSNPRRFFLFSSWLDCAVFSTLLCCRRFEWVKKSCAHATAEYFKLDQQDKNEKVRQNSIDEKKARSKLLQRARMG